MSEETEKKTREVLLVVETNFYYYVENTKTDQEALDKATKMLDNGEPDQNPACGWMKVLRHEVTELDRPSPTEQDTDDNPLDDAANHYAAPC